MVPFGHVHWVGFGWQRLNIWERIMYLMVSDCRWAVNLDCVNSKIITAMYYFSVTVRLTVSSTCAVLFNQSYAHGHHRFTLLLSAPNHNPTPDSLATPLCHCSLRSGTLGATGKFDAVYRRSDSTRSPSKLEHVSIVPSNHVSSCIVSITIGRPSILGRAFRRRDDGMVD